jgi:hypothetical protein
VIPPAELNEPEPIVSAAEELSPLAVPALAAESVQSESSVSAQPPVESAVAAESAVQASSAQLVPEG